MWKLWLLFSFLGVSLSAAGPQGTDANADSNRIVGGEIVDITTVPWQVALSIREGTSSFLCGGSILSNVIVITAAHCVFGVAASDITVRVASNNYFTGGQTYVPVDNFVYPDYNNRNASYDVALLRFGSPIEFNIRARSIGVVETEPLPGETALVTGWGTTSEDGSISNELRGVNVTIVDRTICNTNYSGNATIMNIDQTMICAADLGQDACQGDSGGPLATLDATSGNYVLAGIVSFGIGCAREAFPGVYANCANPDIRNFIRTIAGV